MTEYAVFFVTKLSAKSDKDLSRKTEKVSNAMSMAIGKRVEAHGYVEIEKQDKVKVDNDD